MLYSVPYEFIKRKVDVRVTDTVIEIFGYTGALKAPVRCSGNHLSGYRESLFQM